MKKELRKEGYSKAIDIWSIGCIAALLLTNEHIFPPGADELDKKHAAHTNPAIPHHRDLGIMDYGEAWRTVGRKAKSFIRGCLVLDESERLTAKQALLHPWFTNKHYAADIEAAYRRAIQDWTPREKSDDLIEIMDTRDVAPAASMPAAVKNLAGEVKSHHFQIMPPDMPNCPAFTNSTFGLAQQPRARTLLPAIDDDLDEETIVPESPHLTQNDNTFTSPIDVALPTQCLVNKWSGSMGPPGFQDLALPSSQFMADTGSLVFPSQSTYGLNHPKVIPNELSLPPPPILNNDGIRLPKKVYR